MSSRDKMVDATLSLLRSQGLRATGINQIVKESGAPRGSLYHHFPDGKNQLVIEALRGAGAVVARKIADALDANATTVLALQKYMESYAREIRESDYQRGCPVGNVALDAAASDPAIRAVCNDIFAAWASLISNKLKRDGFSKAGADSTAEFVVASIEGALILCRAQRSTTPLSRVAKRMETIIAGAGRKKSRALRLSNSHD
jgi:TetR/AcrR family transcriptional regulator, lmrAB and yxaGH operons repressor